MNGIVFPAPPSSYQVTDFDHHMLFRVPFDLTVFTRQEEYTDGRTTARGKTKSDIRRDALKDSIPCLFIPSPGSPIYLIYSHGNACDIGQMYPDLVDYAKNWKVNVIAYEYPGYGIFPGSPSADGIKRCIRKVFTFLTDILKVPSNNIIIFGRSIGTGPSTYMAAKVESAKDHSLGALILQSPYTSIREIAKEFVGFLGNLAPKMFDNLGNIELIKCPVILIHGEQDNVIRVEHSQTLYQNLTTSKKKFVSVPDADHNSWDTQADILDPVTQFLSQTLKPVKLDQKVEDIPEWLWFDPEEILVEETSSFSSISRKN